MSEQDVKAIVDAVIAKQPNGDMSKRIASALAVLIACGAIYSVFFQPQTLAAAADNAKDLVKEHSAQVHQAQDSRLNRIEGKLDRLIERE